jgi:hypothetical protein
MVNLLLNQGIDIEENNSSFFIPGDIVATPDTSTFAGWLLCDGSSYLQTDFPDLYAVIGNTYNTVLGQSSPGAGYFRVPRLLGGSLSGPVFITHPWNTSEYSNISNPSHFHVTSPTTFTSSSDGNWAHNHNANPPITTQNWGQHDHFAAPDGTGNPSTNNGANTNGPSNVANTSGSAGNGANLASGVHVHEGVINTNVNVSGQVASHSHNVNTAGGSTVNTVGSHSHTGSAYHSLSGGDHVAPYVTTRFIIKV